MGIERLKFAGRTDTSLVREFFGLHHIAPTPQNFERFFERYVFWLDHILRECKTEMCPGVWEFIHALQTLPQAPLLGLLTGNIRLGAEIKLRHFHLWEAFQTGGFADDHEERDQIAAVTLRRGSRILGTELRGDEVRRYWGYAAGHPLRAGHRREGFSGGDRAAPSSRN